MLTITTVRSAIILRLLVAAVIGAHVVDIDPSTVVNVCADEFVSFTVRAEQLRTNGEQFATIAADWHPALVRVEADRDADADELVAWAQLIASNDLRPILTISYGNHHSNETQPFHPLDQIALLNAARLANLTALTWQLGTAVPSPLRTGQTLAYADDLLALWQVQQALVAGDGRLDWTLVGAAISASTAPELRQMYADLTGRLTAASVHADIQTTTMTLSRPTTSSDDPNPTRTTPQWLDWSDAGACDWDPIERGLRLAERLGAAAQLGYAVLLQPVCEADLLEPSALSLSYYVSLLHKQLMGARVLRTTTSPAGIEAENAVTEDGPDDNNGTSSATLYAHCTVGNAAANSSALTVMAVNRGARAQRIGTGLPATVTGSVVLQYVLRAGDTELLFNEQPVAGVGGVLRPVQRTRRPQRPASFVVPARSVAFWVFPDAVAVECGLNGTGTAERSAELAADLGPPSPAERLLHELIRARVGLPESAVADDVDDEERRSRRHIAGTGGVDVPVPAPRVGAAALQRLFAGKFELPKARKFAPPMLFGTLNNRPDLPAPVASGHRSKGAAVAVPSVVAGVYAGHQRREPAAAEEEEVAKLFRSSENAELPQGDVFVEVGRDDGDGGADYVAFDEPAPGKRAAVDVAGDAVDVEQDDAYPNELLELYAGDSLPAGSDRQRIDDNLEQRVDAELWEQREHRTAAAGGTTYTAAIVPADDAGDEQRAATAGRQSAVPKIVRAREPTWQENQAHLRRAKTALEGMYYRDDSERTSPHDRRKKMSMPNSAEDERFFATRRRRRSVDVKENAVSSEDEEDAGSKQPVTARPTSETNIISPYQERLLVKMSKILHQLQRLIGRRRVDDDDDPSAASTMSTLADELRDIDAYLAGSRTVGRKPAVAPALFGVQGRGLFAGNQKQQQQKPIADDIPLRCKTLALSLEQQCVREIRATGATPAATTRQRRFPRSIGNDAGALDHESWWWWDERSRRTEAAGVLGDADGAWHADDPRNNMIYRVGEERTPFVAFVARKAPATGVIVVDGGDSSAMGRGQSFVGTADVLPTTAGTPTSATSPPATTTATAEPETGVTERRLQPPRFMVTFSRSMEGLLEVMNQHVAGWWQMMS